MKLAQTWMPALWMRRMASGYSAGRLKVLLDDPRGGIRDPHVHYDGKKILLSYRRGGTEAYHLYEIDADGRNLRRLTDGPDNDIEPIYLPDGGIMFCSSRCHRFVPCWRTQVAVLYRCDGDGKNVRMLSNNCDHDNTPWLLPDGRVLYMRWEYVDRSQVHFHHLWTMNPDGTGQMVYFGNMHGNIAMLDAKPIDGSDKIVASFSPGHGRTEHMGHVTVVDPTYGPDNPSAARRITKSANFRDPYGLSENCFLVADKRGIHVMDGQGNTELAYHLPTSDAHMECHEPRPLRGRARDVLLTQAIMKEEKLGDAKPAEDLLTMDGMDSELAFELAGRGVVTMEDLAEQAVDELMDIEGMDAERAGALIMAARAPWFAEESGTDA